MWVQQPTYIRKGLPVRGSLQWRERKLKEKSHKQLCPICGKPIRTRMIKGKPVAFSDEAGMRGSKHPCFHMLDSYSKMRGEDNFDLFPEDLLQ